LPLREARSWGRLGVGRPPKIDLDDVESNRGRGGYAKNYNYDYFTSTPRAGIVNEVNWFGWNLFEGSQSVVPLHIYRGYGPVPRR
jgi:hypothetical protein